ncbi:MAG: agmatinase [Chloroflexi bacterium]|nr:agmatinase [Chloroflexota bacterium]
MPELRDENPHAGSPEEPWPIIRAQSRSFFKAPLCTDLEELDADVALIGVPFDQGTLGRPGARFGPDAIRDAPRAYSYSDPYGKQTSAEGFFDVDAQDELLRGITMADCGNITIVPSEVVENFAKITKAVEKAVERGSFPVVVGGDHAITFPVVRGLHKFAPLNIVHFDAHLDYTHDIQDNLYTHASPIRRCRELDHVGHITSVGIRSARRKPYEEALRDGSLIISKQRFRQLGPRGVAELVPEAENLYITFDIDVIDPSQAPGTGTPETGGLFYDEIRECISELLRKSNLVGFDMVEVAPPYDTSELTVQVASRLIVDILAARFPSR